MNITQYLLTVAAEECAEVAQRLSKAARFGLDEIQPGQPYSNRERIAQEVVDLMATLEMLDEAGHQVTPVSTAGFAEKKAKVEKFMRYSALCGQVTSTGANHG